MTSKVRIRGIVEKTRTDIVGLASRSRGGGEEGGGSSQDGEWMNGSGRRRVAEIEEDGDVEEDFNMGESMSTTDGVEEEMDYTDMDTVAATDGQSSRGDDERYDGREGRGDLEMQIARVYERTIVALGETVDLSAKPLSAFSDL